MEKQEYYIVPAFTIADTVSGRDPHDAVVNFAIGMELNMDNYFKAVPVKAPLSIIRDADNGTIYDTPYFYRVYCLRRRAYKDGTYDWNICIENKSNQRYMVLDTVRGDKKMAQDACLPYVYGTYHEPKGQPYIFEASPVQVMRKDGDVA